MGCGKSLTGLELAKRLGYGFFDTDYLLKQKYDISIDKFVEIYGIERFREAEMIELMTLNKTENTKNRIVACGGGLPYSIGNMEYLNNTGITIYLKTSIETIFERLAREKENRFLIKKLNDNELKTFIKKTLREREIFYNQAKIIFEVKNKNSDIKQTVSNLIKILNINILQNQ